MIDKPASQQIDDIIKMHGGWKADTLSRLRAVVSQADSAVIEEVKWKMATRPEGLPVWSHKGILCFAETWKDNIKLIFPKGAQMEHTTSLFNARLKSATNRAIEFRENDAVDPTALKQIILKAIELNKKNAHK